MLHPSYYYKMFIWLLLLCLRNIFMRLSCFISYKPRLEIAIYFGLRLCCRIYYIYRLTHIYYLQCSWNANHAESLGSHTFLRGRASGIITNKFIGPQGRLNLQERWVNLTELLNGLNLGYKSEKEWKKVQKKQWITLHLSSFVAWSIKSFL